MNSILLYGLILLLVLLVRRYLWMVIRVKGRSMMPTLKNGDILLVRRFLPGAQPFRRGDMVICRYPGRYLWGKRFPMLFVKRVIGLPGEWLEIDHGTLLIDGAPVEEPWLHPDYAHGRGVTKLRRVGRRRYFVAGDHRDNSHDSRSIGALYRTMMVGRVIRVIHIPNRLSAWLQQQDRKLDQLIRRRRKPAKRRKKHEHTANRPVTPAPAVRDSSDG